MSAPFAKQGFDFVHLLGKFGIQGIAHVHALLIQLLLKLADSGFYTYLGYLHLMDLVLNLANLGLDTCLHILYMLQMAFQLLDPGFQCLRFHGDVCIVT